MSGARDRDIDELKQEIALLKDGRAISVSKHQFDSLNAELDRLRKAVLNQSGDNLCWLDRDECRIPPRAEFLESCSRYHAQLSGKCGELQGCRTIAQLEAEVERLKAQNPGIKPIMNSAQWLLLVRFMLVMVRFVIKESMAHEQATIDLHDALVKARRQAEADASAPAMDQAELAKRNVVSGDEFLKAQEAIRSEPTS